MRMSTSVQATVEGEIPSFASIRVTQVAEAVSVIKGMPNGRNGTFSDAGSVALNRAQEHRLNRQSS